MPEPLTPPSAPPPRRKGRWWKLLRRVVVWSIVGVMFLLGLLQLPDFQNWLLRQVTEGISDTLETEVRVDYVRLSWFDELYPGGPLCGG